MVEMTPTQDEYNHLAALFKGGQYEDLKIQASLLLERYPNYGFAWKMLGAALEVQGQDSLQALQKAAEFLPDDARLHCHLGNILLVRGKLNEAVTSYRRALLVKPDYAEAHFKLGNAFQALGQLEGAETSYRKALRIKPDHAEAQCNLGNAILELGRAAEAEASYRRALEINPDYAMAHCNLGISLQKLGRLDEAAASYRRALEIKPDYAGAHSNLAAAYQEQGRLDEAEASCRRALQIKPDHAMAHNNLGKILCDRGDIDQAAVAYKKVLTLAPQGLGMEAAVALATLYYLNGNVEQCISMLEFSRPITAATASALNNNAQKSARAYWCYLNQLLTNRQKPDGESGQRKNLVTLHVVGESHSLAAHGLIVPYHDREMSCVAEWIEGCKQWHLGNNKPNKFKRRFESIMKTLPHESRILLLIGEIDCRPDEGIIKAWQKSQGLSLEDVAKSTAVSYVLYVARIAAQSGHRVTVGGIPATNIRLDTLDTATAARLVKLIRLFNSILKEQALAAGMDFLDTYALTDRGDGVASGEWHIDGNHLLPAAMVEAFSRHLITSAHSAGR